MTKTRTALSLCWLHFASQVNLYQTFLITKNVSLNLFWVFLFLCLSAKTHTHTFSLSPPLSPNRWHPFQSIELNAPEKMPDYFWKKRIKQNYCECFFAIMAPFEQLEKGSNQYALWLQRECHLVLQIIICSRRL